MQPQTQLQAEITTAKMLQRDIKASLKAKTESVQQFYQAKEKVEAIETSPSTPPPQKPTYPPYQRTRWIDDASKEQALLDLAKAEYQDHRDIKRFAEQLSLRPGLVYHTLNHHGFIKETDTTEFRVLQAYYRNNGNLRFMVEETGLSVWICAKTIEKLGYSPHWHEYKATGENAKKGDAAEELFKTLVPSAVDANRTIRRNNALYDFVVNEKLIDVKLTTLSHSKTSKQYRFRVRSRLDQDLPDFFCVFVINDKEKGLQDGNYRILLIPKEVIPDRLFNIHFVHDPKHPTATSALYWDFEVQPCALAAFLDEL